MGILVLALVSIPVYRYGMVYFAVSSGADAGAPRKELVIKQVEKDVDAIQASAKAPNKSVLERSAAVMKDVWTLRRRK